MFVQRCDGHSSVCNRRALELAGITQDTPDPPGARLRPRHRRHAQRPADRNQRNGHRGRRDPDAGRRGQEANLAGLDEHFVERGIVAVCDLLATMVPSPLTTFRAAERQGLQVQCALYLRLAGRRRRIDCPTSPMTIGPAG